MKNRPQQLAIHIQQENHFFPSPNKESSSSLAQRLSSHGPQDSEDEKIRMQQSGIVGHVVQFEQFIPEEERESQSQSRIFNGSSVSSRYDQQQRDRAKRKFMIQIPDSGPSADYHPKKGQFEQSGSKIKEPPAPSNKKNQKNKAFLFPTSLSMPKQQAKQESSAERVRTTAELAKSFDKERQQFYKQKSKLQKELIIKEGQIEILQKTLTTLLGGDPQNILNQCNSALIDSSRIVQKDRQIEALLNRISELNQQLNFRGEELVRYKNQCVQLSHQNETLANQIYVIEKSKNIGTYAQNNISLDEVLYPSYLNNKGTGISQLQKRLEMLTHFRKQYEERDRTKSSSFYSKYSYLGRQTVETPKAGLAYYRRK